MQVFARACGSAIRCLDLVVNKFVSWPLRFFWALPEVNGISVVSAEEGFYLDGNWENGLLEGACL